MPYYSDSNEGDVFCYSSTADFDNGLETFDPDDTYHENDGSWDEYTCYQTKTGSSDDPNSGFSDYSYTTSFYPTDSDVAQGILDFGRYVTASYVSETWFANNNPGGGFVHVNVDELNTAQRTKLDNKLATSQFVTNDPTNSSLPLQNAGLTPIEGTLLDAKTHLLDASRPDSCGNDYVVLLTDGLPSIDKDGNVYSDTTDAIQKNCRCCNNRA